MRKRYWLTVLFAIAILSVALLYRSTRGNTHDSPTVASASPTAAPTAPVTAIPSVLPSTPAPAQTVQPEALEPAPGFLSRITKKFYGTYVTPTSSPVQPERFTGFHTGVDAEFGDVPSEVSIDAINGGTVKLSRRVSGYGGVVIIQSTFLTGTRYVLYGHLDPASLIPLGTAVQQGQKIGVLGEGYTAETDGERKHLHLAVIKTSASEVRGYVQSKAELERIWDDPLPYFK